MQVLLHAASLALAPHPLTCLDACMLTTHPSCSFSPPEAFAPFKLAPGLCYANALENAASAMEIGAVAGINCALLLLRQLTAPGPGVGGGGGGGASTQQGVAVS